MPGSSLGGFTEGLWESIAEGRKRAAEQEETRAKREADILTTLASADDPEIRSMALAGMLEMANPKRRAKGLRGFLGEMETSATLPKIRELLGTPVATQVKTPPVASRSIPVDAAMRATPATPGQQPVAAPPGRPTSASMPQGSLVTPPPSGAPQPPPSVPQSAFSARGPMLQGTERTELRPRQVFLPPEERMRRDTIAREQAEVEGEVEGYIAAGMTRQEAVDLVKQSRIRRAGGGMGQTWAEGEITPDPTSPTGWSQTLYLRADPTQTQKLPAGSPYGRSTRATNPREAIAAELFGQPEEDPRAVLQRLTPEQLGEVDKTVRARGVTTAGETTRARVDATTAGLQARPLTPDEAAQQGVPLGTTPGALVGQTPQTPQQLELRQNLSALTPQIGNIRAAITGKITDPTTGAVSEGLAVLPSKKDLIGNLAPGLVLAARRRDPRYREALARLESAVDIAVNNMARVLGGSRGAQSEKDAERAYSALVNLQGGLLQGDTQEAALVRLAEAEKAIQGVLSVMPAPMAVPPPGSATPSATPPPGAAAAPGRPERYQHPVYGWVEVVGINPQTGKKRVRKVDGPHQ